ncbi:MAG: aminotransferase class III-fold pyridoxal phosphate-dependent enzyme, partial [Rhizobiales bacterium]|nr:aminotransferase class III-fold pyridoxal phosphate-dependent enzyme [Hyphomicrobiales bacterium]
MERLNLHTDMALRARAAKVIPGAMWGHQNVARLPEGYPQYFARAEGCRTWDVDGRGYIDFMCAWGPMLLGYNDPDVEAAAARQREFGDGFNGPSARQVELAELIVDTTWDRLPERVRHEAKRSILNFMATALAGCREDAVEHTLASLAAFSGVEQSTVIGRTERVDALSAAFLNAASGNVFDFDDTHLRTVIHPTAPVLPALFALAELRPVSGRELLLAFALGVLA